MSCISSVSSSQVTTSLVQPFLSSYSWTDTIHGNDMTFQLVSPLNNAAFLAICEMYELSEDDLSSYLKCMAVWCIYNKENQPIGAIQLDFYSTLQDLQKQVTDQELADGLFSAQKYIELSYALNEHSRGKGLGSIAVKCFVDYARSCDWGKHLFAVVDENNQPSIRILKTNRFTYLGTYQHTETLDSILLFQL